MPPKGGKKHRRGGHKRIDPTCDLEEGDRYAIVESRSGGSRINVLTLDNEHVNATIPGRLYKKIWLKKGNYVIISKFENMSIIKGTIADNELGKVRKKFEQMGGDSMKSLISFNYDNQDDDSEDEDDIINVEENLDSDERNGSRRSTKQPLPQPKKDLTLDNLNEEEKNVKIDDDFFDNL